MTDQDKKRMTIQHGAMMLNALADRIESGQLNADDTALCRTWAKELARLAKQATNDLAATKLARAVPRYRVEGWSDFETGQDGISEERDPAGDWVKAGDHVKAVEALMCRIPFRRTEDRTDG